MIEAAAKTDADQPLVAAAVARRDDHPDHRERQREEAAGADALDGAEDDELAPCSAPAPQSAEPTRKIEIATMKSGLRPWTSPSFPYSGTVTVEPST